MSDEFAIVDDDDEQTMVLDEDELNIDEEEEEEEDLLDDNEDDDGFEEDDYDERPSNRGYRPDSNVYTLLIALSVVAYGAALTVVLYELREYCKPELFMWGLFK